MGSYDSQIIEKINRLKKEKNAIIVAHYYQLGETQDIADTVGDALEMTRFAVDSGAKVIIVGGVTCMAETIKLACPEKTVILPDLNAGCTLSNMISLSDFPPGRSSFRTQPLSVISTPRPK